MKTETIDALYENGKLKLSKELDLPEKTKVKVIIMESFSELLDKIGEIEAKENIDNVLKEIRGKNYYE